MCFNRGGRWRLFCLGWGKGKWPCLCGWSGAGRSSILCLQSFQLPEVLIDFSILSLLNRHLHFKLHSVWTQVDVHYILSSSFLHARRIFTPSGTPALCMSIFDWIWGRGVWKRLWHEWGDSNTAFKQIKLELRIFHLKAYMYFSGWLWTWIQNLTPINGRPC